MKADAKAEAAPVGGGSKKKLIIIVASVLVLALAGGGGAWFMLKGEPDEHAEESKPSKKAKKVKPAGPPVYIPVDQFTVNLQPENGEQYLQLAITLQASSLEESEAIKTNMPKLRSRILLLLSSKHASEINTPEGKQQLSKEILEAVNQPFEADGAQQEVTEVLFTAFIIQ
jgi:flagellar protein FliL